MSDLLRVSLQNGKYEVVQDTSGKLIKLFYGREWTELTSDNLVLALAQEVDNLRGKNARLTKFSGGLLAYMVNDVIDTRDRLVAELGNNHPETLEWDKLITEFATKLNLRRSDKNTPKP